MTQCGLFYGVPAKLSNSLEQADSQGDLCSGISLNRYLYQKSL